jgi:superfamily II DNA or RNA helicase
MFSLKKIETDYSFQKDIIESLESALLASNVAIASPATATGKTNMASDIAAKYNKVLVLAHGRKFLRGQFGKSASHKSPLKNVVVVSSKKEYALASQLQNVIIVTLPQTLNSIEDIGHFDLLVVDEAHQFYLAPMVQNIIRKLPEGIKTLLLSATPFNLRSQKYPEVSFTIDRALNAGVVDDVMVEVMRSAYNYDFDAYNANAHLKGTTQFDETHTISSIADVLDKLTQRLSSPWDNKTGRKIAEKVNGALHIPERIKLDKTLIITANIAQANDVSRYLLSKQIRHVVSHSINDVDSENILSFQDESSEIPVCVVVDRARLGFDMPTLINTVDMSGTLNPSLILQMIGRLLRKHPDGKRKRFIKLTPERLHYYVHAVMCVTVSLSYQKFFEYFDESNYEDIKIPLVLMPEEMREAFKKKKSGPKARYSPPISYKVAPDPNIERSLISLARTCEIFSVIGYDPASPLDTSEYITLREVKGRLAGTWYPWSVSCEDMEKHVMELGVNSLGEWNKKDKSSYSHAYRKMWHHVVARNLGWKIKEQKIRSSKKLIEFLDLMGIDSPKQWASVHLPSFLTFVNNQMKWAHSLKKSPYKESTDPIELYISKYMNGLNQYSHHSERNGFSDWGPDIISYFTGRVKESDKEKDIETLEKYDAYHKYRNNEKRKSQYFSKINTLEMQVLEIRRDTIRDEIKAYMMRTGNSRFFEVSHDEQNKILEEREEEHNFQAIILNAVIFSLDKNKKLIKTFENITNFKSILLEIDNTLDIPTWRFSFNFHI